MTLERTTAETSCGNNDEENSPNEVNSQDASPQK